MRTYSLAICGGIALLLLGCVPSIHPLFTSDDLVFQPDLVGKWKADKSDLTVTMEFKKGEKNTYDLVLTEKDGKTADFRVGLTKIEGQLYMDFFPAPNEDALETQADLFWFHLVPAHTFYRVDEISADKLQFAILDADRLHEFLREHPTALKHEWVKSDIDDENEDASALITASTPELRQFFPKHAKTESLFGGKSVFTRVKQDEGAK